MIKKLNEIFEDIFNYAERNQTCLRKAVGCAAVGIHLNGKPFIVSMEHNGPSRKGFPCTNEIGNCGCSHSEPRVVKETLKSYCEDEKLILICTYSPCTNCANIVIDSGLFCGVIYDILTEHDKRGDKFLREAMFVMSKKELNKLTEEEASDQIKKWLSSSIR